MLVTSSCGHGYLGSCKVGCNFKVYVCVSVIYIYVCVYIYIYFFLTDIDYKKLVDPAYNLIDVVVPALQRNNIGKIAELLRSLPPVLKFTLETGKLYSTWAQKEFFKVNIEFS